MKKIIIVLFFIPVLAFGQKDSSVAIKWKRITTYIDSTPVIICYYGEKNVLMYDTLSWMVKVCKNDSCNNIQYVLSNGRELTRKDIFQIKHRNNFTTYIF